MVEKHNRRKILASVGTSISAYALIGSAQAKNQSTNELSKQGNSENQNQSITSG